MDCSKNKLRECCEDCKNCKCSENCKGFTEQLFTEEITGIPLLGPKTIIQPILSTKEENK